MMSFLQPRSDRPASNGSHGTMSHTAGGIAEEARERMADASVEVRKQFSDVEEILKTWIKTRPGLTLGAALAAGVVIGWLIKRR